MSSLMASRGHKRRGNITNQNKPATGQPHMKSKNHNPRLQRTPIRSSSNSYVNRPQRTVPNFSIATNNAMPQAMMPQAMMPQAMMPQAGFAMNGSMKVNSATNSNMQAKNDTNSSIVLASNDNYEVEKSAKEADFHDYSSSTESIVNYTPNKTKKSIMNPSIYGIIILQENNSNFEEQIRELYHQNSKRVYLKIINNNCDKYTSHKINLMEQKYSNSFNIEFTKSDEGIIEIINNNIIQFLLDKSFTYFTWINIDNKYNKSLFELLRLNNNYFSYSNSVLNNENNQIKLYKYKNVEDVSDNYSGCDAFMWHRVAIKKIGLLKTDIKYPEHEYFKRTLTSNFDECIFVNNTLVENSKSLINMIEESSFSHNCVNFNNTLGLSLISEKSFTVSVIIPCIDLNKYTDLCLKYVYKHSSSENIQVIIVVKDDKNRLQIESDLHKIIKNIDTVDFNAELSGEDNVDNINLKNESLNGEPIVRNNIAINIVVSNVKSYSEAINVGLKEAKSDYVIFMNNNIIVDVDWDKKLYDSIVDQKATAVIPITNFSKNNYNNFINITHSSIEDFFEKTRKINHLFKPLINCYQFDLFCIIFNKEELSKIGGIDKHYINSNESQDIFETIKLFNRSVLISTDCIVYNYELTKEYSQELKVYNEYLFEKKWNKTPQHLQAASAQLTTDVYNMEIYRPKSELKDYLDANNRKKFSLEMLSEYINLENGFDIDSKLYKYLNMNNTNHSLYNNNIYNDIYDRAIIKGEIYNKQQIINFMEIDNLFIKNNNFYCLVNDVYIELKLLVSKIYEKTFEEFINDVKIHENTLTDDDNSSLYENSIQVNYEENTNNINRSLVVAFIGDYKVGLFLINKLINSNKINLPVVFVFKNNNVYVKLKNIISFFTNRIVIKTKEYGNDIIPTIQAVHYCLNVLNLNIEYVYKFHTKSNEVWFETLTNYLLDTSEEELIKLLNISLNTKKSNCIGDEKYYLHVNNEDKFCKQLVETYKDFYDKEYFVAGTIFFTKADLFKNVINFIKRNNYRSFFINNMYESNNIHISNSPIHYLERLFGIIKT